MQSQGRCAGTSRFVFRAALGVAITLLLLPAACAQDAEWLRLDRRIRERAEEDFCKAEFFHRVAGDLGMAYFCYQAVYRACPKSALGERAIERMRELWKERENWLAQGASRSGSLMFGVGLQADAGVSGSVVLNERVGCHSKVGCGIEFVTPPDGEEPVRSWEVPDCTPTWPRMDSWLGGILDRPLDEPKGQPTPEPFVCPDTGTLRYGWYFDQNTSAPQKPQIQYTF